MTRTPQNTRLYLHPFSRAYWRDAAAELKSIRTLVVASLMIALRVATKGLAVPIAPQLDLFNVASLINALSAMIIGPVACIPAAVVSDFLGVMIWDGLGSYFFPYVLQEIGSSLIWALLLYRAKATPWRVMIGRFSICMVINVLLGTAINMLYQQVYYGVSSVVLTWPRVIKNIFMFPIETVAITFFLSLMIPITSRMGLTYGSPKVKETMRFSKKQYVLLAVLFALGVGSVLGYLPYHYSTTSLSASYTKEERSQINRNMQTHLVAQSDEYDEVPTLTVVKAAYGKFLSKEVTYNVAVYQVDEGVEVTDTMWEYSRTPASKDENLTLVADAVILVDEKTAQVLSFELTPAAQ